MTSNRSSFFFAVDVGNSFVKIGLFSTQRDANGLTRPLSVCVETTTDFRDAEQWLDSSSRSVPFFNRDESFFWIVSSVNQKTTDRFLDWIGRERRRDSVRVTSLADLPTTFAYDRPEKLGIDRAVAALGASLLFAGSSSVETTSPRRRLPLLIVDVGTATTIDFVDSEGIFRGGVILPGPRISVQALLERTEKLPQIVRNQEKIGGERSATPLYPATNTEDGIAAGIQYSLAGAVFACYWDVYSRQFSTERSVIDSETTKNSAKTKIATDDSEIDLAAAGRDASNDDRLEDETIEKNGANNRNLEPAIVITGRGSGRLDALLRRLFSQIAFLYRRDFVPKIEIRPDLVLSTLAYLGRDVANGES